MALSAEKKKELAVEFGGVATNTGNTEVQVAMLTARINELTDHLRIQKKDKKTMLSLVKMVGQRRKFLNYIAKNDVSKYRALIAKLGIRK
jgi:small subunit ribosomal protein S15